LTLTKSIRRAFALRALLMIAAVAVISFAFWYPLQSQQRSHIRHVTKLSAQSVRTDIADEMRSRILAQVRLATFSEFRELSQSEWEAQAGLLLQHHRGYLAVQWISSDGRLRAAVYGPGYDAADASDPRGNGVGTICHVSQASSYSDQRDVVFTPMFRLPNGKTGRCVIAPIREGLRVDGLLIAAIDEQMSFQDILADHAHLGYAIAISERNEEIFRLQGSGSGKERRYEQSAELRLPGATWLVRVWPQAELLNEVESSLPAMALVVGSVIGLLLFLTLDFARAAYLTSRELRRARDEMEVRVEERTAELQSTNKMLEAEIRERKQVQDSLQVLSARISQLRDEEQRRIARELHDSTAQLLGAASITIERLQKSIHKGDQAKTEKLLKESADLLDKATAEVRTISFLLHPPILDDLGLEGVLPWYAEGFSSRSGIPVQLRLQPELGRFPHEVELAVFRMVQESLANIHRHSRSTSARISVFRNEQQLTLQVADEGCGIRPGTREGIRDEKGPIGVGLAGMQERVRRLGGSLSIASDAENGGTLLTALIPLHRKNPQAAEAQSSATPVAC
jgi:signal transduction histidine kinase